MRSSSSIRTAVGQRSNDLPIRASSLRLPFPKAPPTYAALPCITLRTAFPFVLLRHRRRTSEAPQLTATTDLGLRMSFGDSFSRRGY